MRSKFTLSLVIILCSTGLWSQNSYSVHTVAFYNLENLFDPYDDPETKDEISPILEISFNREEIYQQKVRNMAFVLSEIGKSKTGVSPTLIGVAEIENYNVLQDVLDTDYLNKTPYQYIHYDSPDVRGIDVGLIYNSDYFSPTHHEVFELKLWDEQGYRIYTRDQLLVSGYLEGELIHVIVEHWPSRRGGTSRSSFKREKAAFLTTQIIEQVRLKDPEAKIIIMGDFNDDPTDKSFKSVLKTIDTPSSLEINYLYNPMESLFKNGENTLVYRDQLNLFDQLIFSESFVPKNGNYESLKLLKAGVFKPLYLTTSKGKYKGYPFRSFSSGKFTGGYSDHYPVYAYLIKQIELLRD